jgi:hypothetical protein
MWAASNEAGNLRLGLALNVASRIQWLEIAFCARNAAPIAGRRVHSRNRQTLKLELMEGELSVRCHVPVVCAYSGITILQAALDVLSVIGRAPHVVDVRAVGFEPRGVSIAQLSLA